MMVKIQSCCHKLLCKVLQVNQVKVKNLQSAGAESTLYFESYWSYEFKGTYTLLLSF